MSSDGIPVARGARASSRGRFSIARLHHSGAAPYRLLLVGDAARLWPDGTGIAEHLVELVGTRSGRGLDLDVLWDVLPVMKAMHHDGNAWRLWRYDAVVVVRDGLGHGTHGAERAHIRATVEQWAEVSRVLLVAVDDDGDQDAAHQIEFGAPDGSDARSQPAMPAIEAMVIDGAAAPAVNAELIAAQVLRMARSSPGPVRSPEPVNDEAERQRALDDLRVDEQAIHRRLDQIVRIARDAYGMTAAAVNLVDHDELWTVSAVGTGRGRSAREASLCAKTIGRAAFTVVPDTWQQPDLAGNPLIQGSSGIRFYAAYPIESIDGHRVGTLCVFDREPHDPADLDLTLLRDLALLAEGEIIEAANEPATVEGMHRSRDAEPVRPRTPASE